MFLFFDDPDDPAIAAVGSDPRVTVHRCTAAHWRKISGQERNQLSLNTIQRLNSQIAIASAREEGLEWIVHLDSDELIHAKGSLGATLARAPQSVDVLKLNPLEYVPERDSSERDSEGLFKVACMIRFPSTHPFGRIDDLIIAVQSRLHERALRLARFFGVRDALYLGFMKGHQSGKAATRLSAPIDALACHWPLPLPGHKLQAAILRGAFILHFDAPDYATWKEKWRCRLEGSASVGAREEMKGSRAEQFDQFARHFRANDEAALQSLYERLFMIGSRERRILRALGLLRRVRFGTRSNAR